MPRLKAVQLVKDVAAQQQRRGITRMLRLETLGRHFSEFVVARIVADTRARDVQATKLIRRYFAQIFLMPGPRTSGPADC